MANFCKQCSIEMFGKDFGDFKGVSTETNTRNNLFLIALCEGCGPIQVDHSGICISKDCLEKHNA